MTDCPNGEIRDQLPDYVHDRLSAADRARVAAHVASCAVCAAEVELLAAARRVLTAAAPRIDTARIVAALPSPPAHAVRRPAIVRPQTASRRPVARIIQWRIAAAFVTVALGGVSFAVLRGIQGGTTPPIHAPVVVAPPVVAAPVVATPTPQSVAVVTPRARPAPRGEQLADNNTVAVPDAGRLGDLSDDDVQTLLNDIDQLDGVPDANPQPAVVPVRAGGTL
jgi:anti-sigma factor RsiW